MGSSGTVGRQPGSASDRAGFDSFTNGAKLKANAAAKCARGNRHFNCFNTSIHSPVTKISTNYEDFR
jgi:hypothetical protein